MLSHLLKASVRSRSLLLRPIQLAVAPQRFYFPNGVLMKREEGDYYSDPVVIAERAIRLMALHDNVNDPSAITL